MPVALNGRVPVKVNLEGGVIAIGDRIALSSVPGVGKKASPTDGVTIGFALAPFTESSAEDTVLVFVENRREQQGTSFALLGGESAMLNLSQSFTPTVLDQAAVEIPSLHVLGSGIYEGAQQFNGLTNFVGSVNVMGTISFGQTIFTIPPIFNKDTAGFALIHEGDRRVKVTFESEYLTTPVVTTTLSFEQEDEIDDATAEEIFDANIQSIVVEKSTKGFTILLNESAPRDLRFSWIALAVHQPEIFESVIDGLLFEDEDSLEDQEENDEGEGGEQPAGELPLEEQPPTPTSGEGEGAIPVDPQVPTELEDDPEETLEDTSVDESGGDSESGTDTEPPAQDEQPAAPTTQDAPSSGGEASAAPENAPAAQ